MSRPLTVSLTVVFSFSSSRFRVSVRDCLGLFLLHVFHLHPLAALPNQSFYGKGVRPGAQALHPWAVWDSSSVFTDTLHYELVASSGIRVSQRAARAKVWTGPFCHISLRISSSQVSCPVHLQGDAQPLFFRDMPTGHKPWEANRRRGGRTESREALMCFFPHPFSYNLSSSLSLSFNFQPIKKQGRALFLFEWVKKSSLNFPTVLLNPEFWISLHEVSLTEAQMTAHTSL